MPPLFERPHICGIGGIGTSGLALLLLDQCVCVTGSDLRASELTQLVQKRGARIEFHPAVDWVAQASCLVVPAFLPPDHPEVAAARSAHIPILGRTQALALFCREFAEHTVVCTGSPARSYTASAIARALGDSAGYCIGAVSLDDSFTPHARSQKIMVLDIDERDFFFHPELYNDFSQADIVISGWTVPDFGYYPDLFDYHAFIDRVCASSFRTMVTVPSENESGPSELVAPGMKIAQIAASDYLGSVYGIDKIPEIPEFIGWFQKWKYPMHRHEIRMHPAFVYASLTALKEQADSHEVRIAMRPFISTFRAYSAKIWAQALAPASEILLLDPPYEGCSSEDCVCFCREISELGLNIRITSIAEAHAYARCDDAWIWCGAPDILDY